MQLPEDGFWARWRWVVVAACGLAFLLTMLSVGFAQPTTIVPLVSITLLGLLAALIIHTANQQRQAYRAALHDWSVRQAVQADRLRIATELHDVISHGLGAITIRARAGRLPSPSRPGAAVEALGDVEALARAATDDLRHLLRLLRDESQPAPLLPAPGVVTLPQLVEEARQGGLEVQTNGLEVHGLSPGQELTVHHIVREGLANSARHCGTTSVQVDLGLETSELVVTITDDGPVPGWEATPGAGHGLELLRMRVESLGGVLDFTRQGTGHRLRAVLPRSIND